MSRSRKFDAELAPPSLGDVKQPKRFVSTENRRHFLRSAGRLAALFIVVLPLSRVMDDTATSEHSGEKVSFVSDNPRHMSAWVDTENGDHCFIDMQHEIEGQEIVGIAEDGSDLGTSCDSGQRVVQELPENLGETFAKGRRDEQNYLQKVRAEVRDRSDDHDILYDGSSEWFDMVEGSGGEGYSPSVCILEKGTNLTIVGENFSSRSGGTVDIGEVVLGSGEYMGTQCSVGDLIEINTGT